ncbi:hypothetical protein AA313_de0206904 [Arthrobotrys entomopaga]|nr:hypothetical protein AA313_de0206904 [Arthrobotrys entomopaga]
MLSFIHKSVNPFLPNILQSRPGVNHDYFRPSPVPNDGYPYNTAIDRTGGFSPQEEGPVNIGRFSGADVYYHSRNRRYRSGTSWRSSVDTSVSERSVGDEGLKEYNSQRRIAECDDDDDDEEEEEEEEEEEKREEDGMRKRSISGAV